MAETVTRQLREPFVEAAGLGITDEGLRLLKDKIDTNLIRKHYDRKHGANFYYGQKK